jgi:hypothetical protein
MNRILNRKPRIFTKLEVLAMETNRKDKLMLAVLVLMVLTGMAQAQKGPEKVVVVYPNAYEQTEGEGSAIPNFLDTPFKMQQVFTADQFGALEDKPYLLTHYALRPDKGLSGPTTVTVDDMQIRISVAQRTPGGLSMAFSENVGANEQIVWDGPMTFHTEGAGPATGPKGFDYLIELQRPYLYDPSDGNLLFEYISYSGFHGTSGLREDMVGMGHGYNASLIGATDPEAEFATTATPLQIVQFTFVEPCKYDYGKVIYVNDDATGINNGTSWEDAYIYLQDALVDANNSDKPVEIRVAQGIYRPDLGGGYVPGDREAAFRLINGVTLAGGYAGIDTDDPNARDIELYETTLTGDLNGDDVELSITIGWSSTRDENSYHVLIGSRTDMTAVLDGFIITGGAANGPELDGDDTFYKYRLACGGGMYNEEGSPTLTNCTFSGNCGGLVGGMYNYISNVTLTNCTFSDNSGWTAGGMMNQESSVTLTNCTFSENLRTISFRSNYGLSIPTLTNCIFSGNYGPGGVISYYNWDNPNSGPVSILTNCTFSGNYGGMISYRYWDDPNSVAGPILTNCILWYNTPNEIPQTSTVTYSNIQGGWEGQGNIDEEPLFANPGYCADVNDPNIVAEPDFGNTIWVDGDYHLKSNAGRWDPNSQSWVFDDVTSPCIDAGDPLSPVMYEPHPRGCIINMGAYGGTEEASKSPFGCLYEADSD